MVGKQEMLMSPGQHYYKKTESANKHFVGHYSCFKFARILIQCSKNPIIYFYDLPKHYVYTNSILQTPFLFFHTDEHFLGYHFPGHHILHLESRLVNGASGFKFRA